ncbi:Alpha/beta hydrolase fold-1 [Nemania sp. FL0916]|nr:Alpha/beta hydrolase fold-1 [Nemania sp. FL0916]
MPPTAPIDTSKPGIVLVTGAWHVPAHFDVLRAALSAQGYEVHVPRLPTLSATGLTWLDDARTIQSAVEKRMDDTGKEFVIAAHSYGGVPGCAATKGYTVPERAKEGKRGGFRGILFIAAFALPNPDVDLLTAFGGKFPDWMKVEPAYTKNASSFVYPEAHHAFYSDLPKDKADYYWALLEPQSQEAYETPVDRVASNCGIPHTYLVCENDQALPIPFQEMIITKIPSMKVERCAAGHSPFITMPQRVIEVLEKM